MIEARCCYCKELVKSDWDAVPVLREAQGISVEWCERCQDRVPVRHGDGGKFFDAWKKPAP